MFEPVEDNSWDGFDVGVADRVAVVTAEEVATVKEVVASMVGSVTVVVAAEFGIMVTIAKLPRIVITFCPELQSQSSPPQQYVSFVQ